MKKKVRNLIVILLAAAAAFLYYYISLPAINIHSSGFWMFIITIIIVVIAVYAIRKAGKEYVESEVAEKFGFKFSTYGLKEDKVLRGLGLLLLLVVAVYFVGSVLSSPIVNAKKYQALLSIEEREFTEDIKEVDYRTIPLLDKESAALLGNRKMGSMVDMVSQFEVASDYSQINYKGVPVRVTPLAYASTIKWLTNQSGGIPAYILIDMTTQDTECVKLESGIKYSKSEYFNRNLYRHLRFRFPTYIFDSQIFFEIDEEGTPYWVCPVKKFNIGLFGGQTVGRVVLCNAVTGECIDYAVEDVPQWVDKVYNAELLMDLYDFSGIYKNGFLNSVPVTWAGHT